MTYRRAGVNVDTANRLVTDIKRMVRSTPQRGVVLGIGGFAAVFDMLKKVPAGSYLVSSTDGVGTKLEIAKLRNDHKTVGIDLVAMCVNDLITVGAEPLFFLDYYACGKLQPRQFREVIRGIVEGCKQADCALIGGETAEMPGMYSNGTYDLAGFAVGAVWPRNIPKPEKIRAGDLLLGFASSGVHSNGFSLVRKIFSAGQLRGTVGKRLLTPTVIYVNAMRNLRKAVKIKGLIHVTGGGFYDNIPRVFPKDVGAWIRRGSWPIPEIFEIIQRKGKIPEREMFRTFNMGIGMIAVLDPREIARAKNLLRRSGIKSWIIGEICKGRGVVFG
ncbi:MAG: phosphoribosylformylglycinamidine cyclo-ligase [Candidatus Omnitrophica bacterium]|nr:phosphoribosylformylglycinamidine cyclo-ligase [Candidatus Omnitrophota bacterium]